MVTRKSPPSRRGDGSQSGRWWADGRQGGRMQGARAIRMSGSPYAPRHRSVFRTGEPSTPDGTAPAGFLFPAARAERFLPAEGLALSLPISSLVKTLAGFPECGFWARAFRAASPRESDSERGALAGVTWVRPTDTPLQNRRAALKKQILARSWRPPFGFQLEFGLAPLRSLAVQSTGRRGYCGAPNH